VGEGALLVELDPNADVTPLPSVLESNQIIVSLWQYLKENSPTWLLDSVASYKTLLIEYQCFEIDHYGVIAVLRECLNSSELSTADERLEATAASKIHRIPVCYALEDGDYPHDRQLLSQANSIKQTDIISLHTQSSFRIFAIGFMPNFAYLGELPHALRVPRLKNPRVAVPAGAVAIADNQTAVYPARSPGGWHIIGYTPINLLNHPHYEFQVGDSVQFESISEAGFVEQLAIAQSVPQQKVIDENNQSVLDKNAGNDLRAADD